MDLYLSSDLRFLSAELLDTTVDPVEEERKRRQALLDGLTRGDFPAIGPEGAPVTVTVFSDFQCPYCADMATLLRHHVLPLVDPGKVRLVFRHFPLPMHNWAREAAEAASCAQEQGNDYFWRMHDALFELQSELSPANVIEKLAEQAESFPRFDSERFSRCVAARAASAHIDRDLAFGTENGVTGTPTVFVNDRRVSGGFEQIVTLIRELAEAQTR